MDGGTGIGDTVVGLEGSPRYYGAHGFVPAGPLGFRRPSLRIPGPAFQVRRLPAHEPWMTGTLVHPEVFWELDCVGLREDTAGVPHPSGRFSGPAGER